MWLTMLACTCQGLVDRAPEDGSPEEDLPEEEPPVPLPAPAGPLPVFVRPFADEHTVSNFFDHGSTEPGHALTTSGTLASGLPKHLAYDFNMAVGTELFAVADGRVAIAGDLGPKRCGGGARAKDDVEVWIVTDVTADGSAYVVQYHHLSEVRVAKGDRVTAGQLVARSGNSGCSSGPHLHLQVRRLHDVDRLKGDAVDPWGWSGEGPDPRVLAGRPASVWMWKPGQDPKITRTARAKGEPERVGVARLVALDAARPVDGELVDVAVGSRQRAPVSLRGWTLRNTAGETFALPDRELAPGETLRIWTRKADPGPAEISLGRDRPVWDDARDCAALLDPDGRVISALPYGRGACSPR